MEDPEELSLVYFSESVVEMLTAHCMRTVVAEAFFHWSGKFIPYIFITHFALKEQCY